MRNTGTRGYSGYRGRRPSAKKWVSIVLAVIIVAAAVFLLAQRYMVYDKDGTYHFEPPWSHRDSDGSSKPGLRLRQRQDLEIVIETPTPAQVAEKELHAQELDVSVLAGGMARAIEALPGNINGVAIRLKNADGDLLYPSALPAAIEAKAVAGSSIARGELEELTSSDYYAIARLSTLHDSRFSFAHMTDAAVQQLKYKDYIWYAPDSTFYLAPEKDLTREYLSDIAAEVAALGFDELLLDDFAYPTVGRQENIKTDERGMTKQEALTLLAGNLREAVSDFGAKLSLVMDEATVLAGGNATSGQDLASLANVFDRIYVPTTEEGIPALREALAPYSAELVPILAMPPETEGGTFFIASPS